MSYNILNSQSKSFTMNMFIIVCLVISNIIWAIAFAMNTKTVKKQFRIIECQNNEIDNLLKRLDRKIIECTRMGLSISWLNTQNKHNVEAADRMANENIELLLRLQENKLEEQSYESALNNHWGELEHQYDTVRPFI